MIGHQRSIQCGAVDWCARSGIGDGTDGVQGAAMGRDRRGSVTNSASAAAGGRANYQWTSQRVLPCPRRAHSSPTTAAGSAHRAQAAPQQSFGLRHLRPVRTADVRQGLRRG